MNHRLSTTISPKHWELLKKHAGKYETQQKVLEAALENLENNSQNTILSLEEKQILRLFREMKTMVISQRDLQGILIETSDVQKVIDVIRNQKMSEFFMAWFYQKPLSKCSMIELMEGTIFFIKAGNMNDMVGYSDDGDHYTLKLVHNFGINNSKIMNTLIVSIFETYGARTESEISEKSLFVKIYKNL